MAVYTEVSEQDARALIAPLHIGTLQSLRGIGAGIENTNYFLDTDRGAWVLTVFERLGADELPFYLQLMRHLARHGLPVPEPRAVATSGALMQTLHEKPCAVVNKLAGASVVTPTSHHLQEVGSMLARMHLAVADFEGTQANLRGLSWWQATAPVVRPHLSAAQAALLDSELDFQSSLADTIAWATMPRGAVHADLFRDNVLFDGPAGRERLSGVFDFYFAGVDHLVFDLAVCLNDWCTDPSTGRLDERMAHVLVQAYERERALSAVEREHLPAALRAGALRFWLSRLWDHHRPRAAKMLKAHDPTHFERVLRASVTQPFWP